MPRMASRRPAHRPRLRRAIQGQRANELAAGRVRSALVDMCQLTPTDGPRRVYAPGKAHNLCRPKKEATPGSGHGGAIRGRLGVRE